MKNIAVCISLHKTTFLFIIAVLFLLLAHTVSTTSLSASEASSHTGKSSLSLSGKMVNYVPVRIEQEKKAIRGVRWHGQTAVQSIQGQACLSVSRISEMGANSGVSLNEGKNVQVQENYGKLPLYFVQNNGQMEETIRFYEKGSGHATFFTNKGIYFFVSRQQSEVSVRESGIRGQNQKAKGKGQEGIEAGKQGSWCHEQIPVQGIQGQAYLSVSRISRGDTQTGKGAAENKHGEVSNLQTQNSKLHNKHSEIVKTDSYQLEFIPTNQQSAIRNLKSEIIKFLPLGANKTPKIIAEGLQEGKVNYFIGNNHTKWKTNIPTYRAVVYKEIYKDIDMRFYGNNRQMEYDIIVKPGANPSRVRFAYSGIEDLRVTDEGDLEIYLKGGRFIQKKPRIYQEIDGKRVDVEGRFKIYDTGKLRPGFSSQESESGTEITDRNQRNSKLEIHNNARTNLFVRATHKQGQQSETPNKNSKIQNPKFIHGFQIASYDKRYSLIIDPALVYSTYLGGDGSDAGNGIAVDTSGNVYVTGQTYSSNFPTVSTIYGSNPGDSDAFVTKLNASGNALVYSTYLGGSSFDTGRGIAVDASGNAYITGQTVSTDFPTASAIFGSIAESPDAFVTKLNASGNSLVYSTYLGGSNVDAGMGIAIDTSGNAYVTGFTGSTDFPAVSAIYGSNAGGNDAFITKINALGSSLVYSTYLGGSGNEIMGFLLANGGIAIDTTGNAYVAGQTESTDFPTISAIYGSKAGVSDAFVTKLNASGNSLVYSTYLGGNAQDLGNGIAVDTSGNVYVTGLTLSTDFPTASAIYGSKAGVGDAFVTKLNTSGNTLVYSTYLGGSDGDSGFGIAVDTSGNAYVTGFTGSTDFPTAAAIFGSNGSKSGFNDAYITKLTASGSSLVYSTYLGGSFSDAGNGIAIDASGNAYVTGQTESPDFPTASAIYGSYAGDDAFITKTTSDTIPGTIYGYVVDKKEYPIKSAKVKLRGKKTKIFRSTSSDDTGFFQFTDLHADTYSASAKKKGYKKTKQKVEFEEGGIKEIEFKMKKKEARN